jgi:hypothetical protein
LPILHNEFVKRQNDVFEYTPEHIKELDKCSKEFWHFLSYVKIVHPDEGRIEFEPYPFQKEIFKTIAEKQFIVLNISRQTGKCVQNQTLINIRNKKTGEIEEISIGNFYEREKNKQVYNPDENI